MRNLLFTWYLLLFMTLWILKFIPKWIPKWKATLALVLECYDCLRKFAEYALLSMIVVVDT
jgi:hypothetical protein